MKWGTAFGKTVPFVYGYLRTAQLVYLLGKEFHSNEGTGGRLKGGGG